MLADVSWNSSWRSLGSIWVAARKQGGHTFTGQPTGAQGHRAHTESPPPSSAPAEPGRAAEVEQGDAQRVTEGKDKEAKPTPQKTGASETMRAEGHL